MKKVKSVFVGFLAIGIVITILGFFGWLYKPLLIALFFLIISLFLYCLKFLLGKIPSLPKFEKYLVYFFIFIWSLHFLQILVPETGFDALWYHLPVVDKVYENQGLVYFPELYQSLNPLFADLYFLTGYAAFGSLGTKIISYIFALFLSFSSYFLSRVFLNKRFSLLITILVSTFQVVTWQSTSFYVDVAKAFFEITGLLFLLSAVGKKSRKIEKYFFSGFYFSASLATKLFSVLLLPIYIFFLQQKVKYEQKKIYYYLISLFPFLLPTFYYLFAYLNTGNPFYSVVLHLDKLQEIGGNQNSFQYIFQKAISLPKSLLAFVFARDYINPFLVLFFIPIGLKIKNIWKNQNIRFLFLFSTYQWLLWWFIPPTSTRYALSGFVTLLILGVYTVKKFFIKDQQQNKKLIILLLVISVISILPRFFVAKRSLKFIITSQTQQEYLEQFYDGNIDEKIDNWYKNTQL